MICVYDPFNENFNTLGDAVLTPIKATVRQAAGGSYDITIVHPIDPDGKWKHMKPGAIVKAPVQPEVIENAFSGYDVDVYTVNAATGLRETATSPQMISYTAWVSGTEYDAGEKVTLTQLGRNYEAVINIRNAATTASPHLCYFWREIPRYTAGPNILVTLPAGTELYMVENAGSGWYLMSTYYGIQGYVLSSEVTYSHHLSPTETKAHTITEQLFRLREPVVDDDANTVTATGMHVSYDLAGILIKMLDLSAAPPAYALSRITEGLMLPYRGTIATNLTAEDGSYSGSFKGKNGIFAILDPDVGIVPSFDAKFTRDNWDLFVMKKTDTGRKYIIRYGKNEKGSNWKRSNTNLVTIVVPVAKDEDGTDLFLPEEYIEGPNANNYPCPIMEYLQVRGQVGRDKGTGDDSKWTKADLLNEMRTQAGQRFSKWHADEIKQELTVQFEQQGDTAEYPWLKELESALLYDKVWVINERVAGMNLQLYVTETEYDSIRRKLIGLKLKNVNEYGARNVTGYNVVNNSIGAEKLTDAAISYIAKEAMHEAEDNSLSDYTPVENVLNSDNTWKALSAAQGKELKRQIDELRRLIPHN